MVHLPQLLRTLTAGTLATAAGIAGLASPGLAPSPAQAAEEFRIRVTGPLLLTLSVDSLETFAETGEITGDLRLYANFLNDETLAGLRQMLQFRFPLDVVTVSNLSYSPLGRDTLTNIGKVIESTPGVNGFHGLRGAVINAAANADEEGWTLIDVMREFPTASIDVSLDGLMALQRELSVYFSYNQAVVQAIEAQAEAELATQASINPAALPDLAQPGPYRFSQRTITVTNPALRQTGEGLLVNYDFDVDVYLPEGVSGPAPVVIVSHGFGAVKEDFIFLNTHLASHGYVVMAPDHVGSNLSYREQYLGGRLNTLLSPVEFVNRPEEISFLIDELEMLVAQSPDWRSRLDLGRIGVIGDSLGGATVLSLAGAEITYARLQEACDSEVLSLNFARYLECRALYLPPNNYDLGDDRIQAVIAAHPLGGGLFGPEGISQIDIPLLMVSGNVDIVAPVVVEQIFPYVWMQQEPRYLALLQQGTHFSSKPPGEGAGGMPSILMGEHRDVGSTYYKRLTTAFLGAHLRGDEAFLPQLTAANARAMSQDQPMTVDIITALSPEQIEAAYPGNAPVAIVPPPLENVPAPREQSILAAIQETGELRVAMRRDAAPFGYLEDQAGWTGYCPSLTQGLRDFLSAELNTPITIELVELPSTLEDRYDLVRDGNVYLECGPNTIRQDETGITFSEVIFATGTHLLTTALNAPNINPNVPLAGLNIGVLGNTTNELLLADQFPEANAVVFDGPTGRIDAIRSVYDGSIDAFLGDDVLSIAAVLNSDLAVSNLTLVPELPLSCEFYALALPDNDPEWRSTVNEFLNGEVGGSSWETQLADYAAYAFNSLEYCLNR